MLLLLLQIGIFCVFFSPFTQENLRSILIQFCTIKHYSKLEVVLIKCCFNFQLFKNHYVPIKCLDVASFVWRISGEIVFQKSMFLRGSLLKYKQNSKASVHLNPLWLCVISIPASASDCAHSNWIAFISEDKQIFKRLFPIFISNFLSFSLTFLLPPFSYRLSSKKLPSTVEMEMNIALLYPSNLSSFINFDLLYFYLSCTHPLVLPPDNFLLFPTSSSTCVSRPTGCCCSNVTVFSNPNDKLVNAML